MKMCPHPLCLTASTTKARHKRGGRKNYIRQPQPWPPGRRVQLSHTAPLNFLPSQALTNSMSRPCEDGTL